MNRPLPIPRYNQRIPYMRARIPSGLRLGWLTSFLLATIFIPSSLFASNLGDTARQLAHKIAAASGPGAFAIEVSNRSSLDDKSVREVRSALVGELQVDGVNTAQADQAIGTIAVILSESLREYVWTAEIIVGSDEKKIALVSLPQTQNGAPFTAATPIVLKATFLLAQERPMLDFALVDMAGGSHLIVLADNAVSILRHRGANPPGNSIGSWDLEVSLPIAHARIFPRDLRGRLLLRRDHLFDVYLPGTFCRSSTNAIAPLTLTCNDSDDPWPLTPDDNSVRAFYAPARNFFTGALSPGIGKISNVPSFYSTAVLPRSGYTLWAFAAVDGSLHLVDGLTDQAVRSATSNLGSDVTAVRSDCGAGTQLLISDNESGKQGDAAHDHLRAFEIPDREPIAVSAGMEFGGQIVALWPESSGNGAAAIIRMKNTGWYEAYRVSITCGN
jgi:hypothetical protein